MILCCHVICCYFHPFRPPVRAFLIRHFTLSYDSTHLLFLDWVSDHCLSPASAMYRMLVDRRWLHAEYPHPRTVLVVLYEAHEGNRQKERQKLNTDKENVVSRKHARKIQTSRNKEIEKRTRGILCYIRVNISDLKGREVETVRTQRQELSEEGSCPELCAPCEKQTASSNIASRPEE